MAFVTEVFNEIIILVSAEICFVHEIEITKEKTNRLHTLNEYNRESDVYRNEIAYFLIRSFTVKSSKTLKVHSNLRFIWSEILSEKITKIEHTTHYWTLQHMQKLAK